MSDLCLVRRRPCTLLAVVVLSALAGVGCRRPGPPEPETYPVTGEVVSKGGRRLVGGMVEFRSKANPELSATGTIEPTGSFSLITLYKGKSLVGAVEGQYEVTVIPPMGPDQATSPINLSTPYRVRPEGNNHYTFRID